MEKQGIERVPLGAELGVGGRAAHFALALLLVDVATTTCESVLVTRIAADTLQKRKHQHA